MYHSQYKQDTLLDKVVFRGKTNGFFVDVGAHDGVTINNTLYFQRHLGWSGINIEPLPEIFEQLCQNRKSDINLNYAIHTEEGVRDFTRLTGYPEMLSGLTQEYDPRHLQRIKTEMEVKGGEMKTIQVRTRRLESIFEEYGVTHVDFLSVDVEGAELSVISSINFDKVEIDVIFFENNYEEQTKKVIEYLCNKGYFAFFTGPDVFMSRKGFDVDVTIVKAL